MHVTACAHCAHILTHLIKVVSNEDKIHTAEPKLCDE